MAARLAEDALLRAKALAPVFVELWRGRRRGAKPIRLVPQAIDTPPSRQDSPPPCVHLKGRNGSRGAYGRVNKPRSSWTDVDNVTRPRQSPDGAIPDQGYFTKLPLRAH